jgi:hypothetical protein
MGGITNTTVWSSSRSLPDAEKSERIALPAQ